MNKIINRKSRAVENLVQQEILYNTKSCVIENLMQ